MQSAHEYRPRPDFPTASRRPGVVPVVAGTADGAEATRARSRHPHAAGRGRVTGGDAGGTVSWSDVRKVLTVIRSHYGAAVAVNDRFRVVEARTRTPRAVRCSGERTGTRGTGPVA
ncbi:hypothetical protein GCM10023238_08240 [Streptomyces heliomycini]